MNRGRCGTDTHNITEQKKYLLVFIVWLQKAEGQRFVYLIAQGYKINLSGLYAQGCFMCVVMAH